MIAPADGIRGMAENPAFAATVPAFGSTRARAWWRPCVRIASAGVAGIALGAAVAWVAIAFPTTGARVPARLLHALIDTVPVARPNG